MQYSLRSWAAARDIGEHRAVSVNRLISAVSLAAFILMASMPAPKDQDETELAEALSHFEGSHNRYGPREWSISGYSGVPYTHPSDVQLDRPSDKTDLTIRNVPWIARPFRHPIYYGYRLNHWTGTKPYGAMIDFTHNKTIAVKTEPLPTKGTFRGEAIDTMRKPQDFYKKLELSHGHNTLALNGMLRLPFSTDRARPYLGAGGGIAIPHFEVHVRGDEKRTYEYKWVGSGWQILGGVEFPIGSNFSLFVEYKLVFAPINGELSTAGGGHIRTRLWSHQVVAGFTFRKPSATN